MIKKVIMWSYHGLLQSLSGINMTACLILRCTSKSTKSPLNGNDNKLPGKYTHM